MSSVVYFVVIFFSLLEGRYILRNRLWFETNAFHVGADLLGNFFKHLLC